MTASKNVSNGSSRILVVEDSPTQAEQLRYLLEQHGYLVTVAATGTQALVAARREKPAVILSDIVMPEMDGYEFCRTVKSDGQLRDVPVILVTSLSGAEDVVKSLQCGADNFIRKPYEEKYLLARINYALTNRTLREKEKVQIGVHISLGGELHFITADQQQILGLLISTYEEAIHLNEDLKAREEQLTRANLTLTGLYRIAKVLNAATSEREVIEQVLERAVELPGVQAGWIVLRQGDASFRLAGARGLPPALEAPGAMEGDCLCRRRLLSGELSQVTNILECERLQKAQGDTRGGRFHASIPLGAGDRTVGVMNLASSQEGLFKDEELQILNGVGNQIALALERARLREHLEDEVEDRTAALRLEINERELTEAALRTSEAKYRGLFERIAEGVYQSSIAGQLLSANPALVNMLGYESEAEALALDVARDIFAKPEERQLFLKRLEEHGEVRNFEVELRRKDGNSIMALINARAISDERGVLQHYEGTLTDITDRKSLEEQFQQAQKLEAVGRLAGGVAHDFNNLLTAILGYSNILLDGLATSRQTPTDLRKDLEEIRRAGERAAALTRQLLAFSRKQIVQPTVFNLNGVVANLEGMLRRLIGEDVDLRSVLAPDLGQVRADAGQLDQVLMNLAVNARDAMPTGGKLTIETANVELDEAYTRAHVSVTPGRYVMMAVSDTGVGMSPEVQARLFEPFFTTKERGKGTGLGLATVYGIVKQNGGNIWVYSEPGQGTTFKIYLPLVDEPAADAGQGEHAEEVRGGSETVLLVEDEELVRVLARQVLTRHGYAVLEAGNAEEALRVGAGHAGPIHLLLTDVVMPGMSGRSLAEGLAQTHPEVRVLYMSGYTDNAIVHHGVLAPGVTLLQKPFTPRSIARAVREILGTGRGSSP